MPTSSNADHAFPQPTDSSGRGRAVENSLMELPAWWRVSTIPTCVFCASENEGKRGC
jgi:hypothetical protein